MVEMVEMPIVRINRPYLSAWMKTHVCIKNGWFFRIKRRWVSKGGIRMVELVGVQGKEIPWRNKLKEEWTEPATLGEYYVSKFPIPRLVRFVERRLQ